MRPLEVKFPRGAEKDLEEYLKKIKNIRIFRRTQGVLEVIKGNHVESVSQMLRFANSALRKWIRRYVAYGIEGLNDIKREGRPKKITDEIEEEIIRLLQEDPLTYNSIYSQEINALFLNICKIDICCDN